MKLLTLRISLLAFSLGLAARARAYIEVYPTANQIEVPAGGSHVGTVHIKNNLDKPVTIGSRIYDWEYMQPSGAKKMLPPGSTPHSCSNWILLDPPEFPLAPGESRDVRYTVTVPTGTTGEYASTVIFGGKPPKPGQAEGVSVTISLQIASVFLVQIKGTQEYKGQVTKMQVVSAEPDGLLEVAAAFKNTGNVRIAAVGRLAIMDKKGHAVGWTKFPDIKTLPGQEWEVKGEWSGLPAGKYRLVGTFEIGPGKVLIEERDVEIK